MARTPSTQLESHRLLHKSRTYRPRSPVPTKLQANPHAEHALTRSFSCWTLWLLTVDHSTSLRDFLSLLLEERRQLRVAVNLSHSGTSQSEHANQTGSSTPVLPD